MATNSTKEINKWNVVYNQKTDEMRVQYTDKGVPVPSGTIEDFLPGIKIGKNNNKVVEVIVEGYDAFWQSDEDRARELSRIVASLADGN